VILFNTLLFFIFGAIIGSFLNVVVLRYNTGCSFVKGRSKCFSCSKELSWYELVPIFSFLFLKGRCFGCKSKISIQYPLVEFITGVLFSFVFLKFGFDTFLPAYLFITALLVAMAIYDFMHKIIPDGMVFVFDLLALILVFMKTGFISSFQMPGFLNLFAGIVLFAFFGGLWLVSSGKWMGFGDAKLSLGIGWLLGMSGGIFSIMLAFWIGAIFSIVLLILEKLNLSNKKLTIKSEIPFAPFIIFAFFIEFLLGWGSVYVGYLFNF